MASKQRVFVFTDAATDDLQAIYYLASKTKITGIILDTCVSDLDNALRNLTLFGILFFGGKLKIYLGSLTTIPNIPIEWRLDAQYTRYYLEGLYYAKYGNLDYCIPSYKSWQSVCFDDAVLVTQTRVTTAVKVLERFCVRHVYSMLGNAPGDPTGEINAEADLKAYRKLLTYPNVSDFTLVDITQDKIDAARAYCASSPMKRKLHPSPPLIDIINPPSREGWPFWDLTMVMNFF